MRLLAFASGFMSHRFSIQVLGLTCYIPPASHNLLTVLKIACTMPSVPRGYRTACRLPETPLPLTSSPSPEPLQAPLYNFSWPSTSTVAWGIVFFFSLRLFWEYMRISQSRSTNGAIVSDRSNIPRYIFALLSILLCPLIWMILSIVVLYISLQLLEVYKSRKYRTVNNKQYQALRHAHNDTEKPQLEEYPFSVGKTVNQTLQTVHHRKIFETSEQPNPTPLEYHQPIQLRPPTTKLNSPHHSTFPITNPHPPFPTLPFQQATLITPTHLPLPNIRQHSFPPGSSNSQPRFLPPLSQQRPAIPYTTLSPLNMRSPHMMGGWRKDTVIKANGCRRHVLLAQGLPLEARGGGMGGY